MATYRLLLVEDEPLIAFSLEAVFSEGGYDVLTVDNGAGALVEVQRAPAQFDCLFTDVRMPGGMDGWLLAERVRELRPDMPVIYSTGDSYDQWERRGVPGSFALAKPHKLEEARKAVDHLLKRAS